MRAIRDGFGKALLELGKRDKDILALSADLAESVRTNLFKEEFPDRHIEVGIAEQNMMGVASGLAACKKKPYVGSFAVFNPGRNLDQLRTSVCYSNMDVKVIGAHAGITVGEDGATHQASEDLAITRSLPNMTVIVPCDHDEMYNAVLASHRHYGPMYIRSSRAKVEDVTKLDDKFEIGKAKLMKSGYDGTIIACGIMVQEALKAAEALKDEGIDVRVLNMHTIKPIDKEAIAKSAKETGFIVTAEEHQINGGLGSAVSEVVVQDFPVPMRFVGMRDTFAESGDAKELMAKYGLTQKDIVNAVRELKK